MNLVPKSCETCGDAFAPKQRRSRFCSERCRKASYGDPCVDCGGRTIYGAEKARVSQPRCDECNRRFRSDRRCERAMAMLALRRQGKNNIEIAAILGCPYFSVNTELHRLRVIGFAMPKVYGPGRPARDRFTLATTHEAEVLGRELAKRGCVPERERAAA